MSRRDRVERRQRRALAIAMALSIAVHGVALALAKWNVPLWPGGDREVAAGPAPADADPERRPLEVVRLRIVGAAVAGAGPGAEGVSASAPAAAGPSRPRVAARGATPDLAPVARRPVALPLASAGHAGRGIADGGARDPNRGIVFVGASEAARLAERDLERAARAGRLSGASGRGRGISISIVGSGADCDTPATGVFGSFAGSFGRGSGGIGRRF